jgi:hypothetical protein
MDFDETYELKFQPYIEVLGIEFGIFFEIFCDKEFSLVLREFKNILSSSQE